MRIDTNSAKLRKQRFNIQHRILIVFEKLRQKYSHARARKRLEKYDQKYRQENPERERPEPFHVETLFDEFVCCFGGKKISDLIQNKSHMPMNADYLFIEHNVIAELKTLEGIYSGPDAIQQLRQAYIDSGCNELDPVAHLLLDEPMPPAAASLVQRRMRRSIEQRIKKARKQLRHSKDQFGNKDTKLLILIAMDQRPLFGHKTMLFNLATIMGDNYSDEYTDGVVYLNPNTPTKLHANSMEYAGWYPFYRDDKTNDGLSDFVNLLGNRWLTFYGNKIGEKNPILEMKSFDGIIAALEN